MTPREVLARKNSPDATPAEQRNNKVVRITEDIYAAHESFEDDTIVSVWVTRFLNSLYKQAKYDLEPGDLIILQRTMPGSIQLWFGDERVPREL